MLSKIWTMIAVIFEAFPNEERQGDYFDIAAKLRPELERINGFISVERFQSITNPAKVLSLSFWKDEESIQLWRNVEMHRHAQQAGRDFIFHDYRLRIANVVRDYSLKEREQAPSDSKNFHQ